MLGFRAIPITLYDLDRVEETLGALLLEIVDVVAANPKSMDFVQDLFSQQGKSMTTSALDNAHSAAADALLPWLHRRTPAANCHPRRLKASPRRCRPRRTSRP